MSLVRTFKAVTKELSLEDCSENCHEFNEEIQDSHRGFVTRGVLGGLP